MKGRARPAVGGTRNGYLGGLGPARRAQAHGYCCERASSGAAQGGGENAHWEQPRRPYTLPVPNGGRKSGRPAAERTTRPRGGTRARGREGPHALKSTGHHRRGLCTRGGRRPGTAGGTKDRGGSAGTTEDRPPSTLRTAPPYHYPDAGLRPGTAPTPSNHCPPCGRGGSAGVEARLDANAHTNAGARRRPGEPQRPPAQGASPGRETSACLPAAGRGREGSTR